VRRDVGMTGEITLRGRVLPVGGVREKVLAAYRAGLKTVILPRKNLKDLVDVPKRVRNEMNIVPVDHLDQVLEVALVLPVQQPKSVRSRRAVINRKKNGEPKTTNSLDEPRPRSLNDTPPIQPGV